ncbi:hypothetical protein [Thermus thermamylovorans]|uniref:hypothetical protein n=1 Tax=Thermus thermamylovorans TaxID=2509362 RepID=UPI001375B26B|nr:hypothetical protein [Thermus thermamylovorans]
MGGPQPTRAVIDPTARTVAVSGKPVWVSGIQAPTCEPYAGLNRCFVGSGTYAFQAP